jgi:hypothetical protein
MLALFTVEAMESPDNVVGLVSTFGGIKPVASAD